MIHSKSGIAPPRRAPVLAGNAGNEGPETLYMAVDAATTRRIAHLARIAVKDEEVAHLQGEINAVLTFVEQLAEVDEPEPVES